MNGACNFTKELKENSLKNSILKKYWGPQHDCYIQIGVITMCVIRGMPCTCIHLKIVTYIS